MLSFRKLLPIVIGIGCILLLPEIAVADPIHPHPCHPSTTPWTLTRNPAITVSPAAGGVFSIMIGGVQFDQLAPAPGPGCSYETSDVTSIDVLLNFNNAGGLITTNNVTGFRGQVIFQPIRAGLPFNFANGQLGNPSIEFTLHTVGIAFHVTPGNLFGVTLADINIAQLPQGLVTGTITASGNHYYRDVVVPEPTTMLLLGTGLAGVTIKTRKRLKRRKSG